jgi:hypothetical protein
VSATPTAPSLDLNINIADLTSASQLKNLIQGNATPVFTFGAQMAPYWSAPVQSIPNGASATITISGSGNWKTGTGIGFGLTASAKCELKVVTEGAVLEYAADLKSQPTSQLPGTPYPGSAYIVLSLDFQISGSVSGSGNISGFGISGNVKGSTDTSVVFCHLVSGRQSLSDAVEDAFERFVFPFQPTCAMDISAGDVAQVNFNGSLALSIDVSYGIKTVSFSAPGVASALDSVAKGAAQFTLPSETIDIGADATVNYTHSDDFTAIVQKLDNTNAFLYIMRSHKNETGEGLTLSAKVTITNNPGVAVNSQQLQQAVNSITGIGGEQVAAYASDLAQGLSGKLNTWINNTIDKGASLGLEWDQQHDVSMLFKYQVNLANTTIVNQSWTALCNGNLRGAVVLGGLIPEEGSGISNELSHSFTTSLQFFNLFSASSKSTYFAKSYITITQNGDLRYMYDIGKESDVDVNQTKRTCLIHFVATVDQASAQTVSAATVNLELELVATNDSQEAGRVGDLVGLIAPNQQVNQAQKTMQQFVSSNPSGTLDLICVLTPSAYGRLSCSEYVGNKPPLNQQQDSENWSYFHDACVTLLDLAFVETLSYNDWQTFNVLCVYGEGFNGTPDRRSKGNPAAVPPDSWSNISAPAALIEYYLLNSADFMDLCDDLHQLAGLATAPTTSTQDIATYNDLLTSLVELIVKGDVNTDYSKPAIGALLALSNPQRVTSNFVTSNNSLTCNLTLN